MKNSAEYNSVFIVELFDQANMGQGSLGQSSLAQTVWVVPVMLEFAIFINVEEFWVISLLVTDFLHTKKSPAIWK